MNRSWTSDEQPILQTSSRTVELLRAARPGHGPHVLLVLHAAEAIHAHDERCRALPVCGSRDRWSGADFAEFSRAPRSFPVDKWHCFVISVPIGIVCQQDSISLSWGPELFTPTVTVTAQV